MTLQINRKKFTVTEYHKMAEVGLIKNSDRVELINGEIITMSPIKSLHAGIVDMLLEFLIFNLYKKVTVKCQNPISISNQSEPEPDIVIAKYKADSYQSSHPTPEEILILIEVSDSTLVYDQTIKSALYASANISEYWIINLLDKQVEIHRQPKNGEYHFKQIISQETTIQTDLIDLTIQYSDIFKNP